MSAINKFRTAFISASSSERAQILFRASNANKANSSIVNLLSNANLNDTNVKNKMRADNIYFICQQLEAFSNFVFVS